ncbi:hypothetical protein ANCCEY_09904 [Ancylostoma ceylanicum]|uniref:Uncharacterized protein n=1 Tax=Ancylostoma ceylanicum TaxID=53326 RepID=A0A0D6LGA8_9BILA|nr:hypothetical protein ANCCEY_09904 [Ancylostoma ceylanicum]
MEKDFDEEANKKLVRLLSQKFLESRKNVKVSGKFQPSTDIKPPEEDCDEEASGEKATAVSPTEDIINNTVDTEDVDDLSQKPKIPAEKEAHIQDFLNTLRTFLSRAEHSDLSDEDKKTEPEESRDGDDEQEKPKLGKNYVKTERLSPKDLKNQPDDSDEAKEVSDEDGDEPKEVSAYPPDPNSEPQDNDDDGDLTQDNNDSFDSEHVDKSNMDNSFDSDQVDRSLNILDTKAHTEPFEESVSTVRMPVEEDEDKGVEVGTEKTPEARRAEKRRLEKAKRKKDRVAKDAPKPKSTADDPDDPDDADTSDPKDSVENPFNLPTLPTLPTLPPPGHPPPTLPPITPMPGLDNLLQTISAQWRQIFPNARIPTFKPDE